MSTTTDVLEWARAFDDTDRSIGRDVIGDVLVSTVFLGIDHRFGDGGDPLLWETMVFAAGDEQHCQRYSSEAAARARHAEIVTAFRAAESAGDVAEALFNQAEADENG